MSLFTAVTKETVTTLRCPPELSVAAAAEFEKVSLSWLKEQSRLYVVDFSGVKVFDNAMFRPFVLFFQQLKNKGIFLASINVSLETLSVMQLNGLDSVLNPKKSLEEAHAVAGIKVSKGPIDVQFINPFIKATQTTLETQASTKVTIGKPYLKKDGATNFDIAGVISLTSEAFQGSIALCFPAKVFLAIYSNMLGEKHETITKEIEDAAGELLNIIFGQAKVELNQKGGYAIQKAIPTIVRGSGLEVHHLTRNVAVILPFETEAGSFQLEVSTEVTS